MRTRFNSGGLWFPAGGWLAPPQMCAALAASPSIVQRTGYQAESFTAVESGWRVEGKRSSTNMD